MMDGERRQNYLEALHQSSAETFGENVVSSALNFLVEKVKNYLKKQDIQLGTVFERYLKNASKRYNQVKTLATGTDSRNIIGRNNFYVKIGVNYKGQEINTSTVDNLIEINNNILIEGTGGAGKSMLSRYLFLQTVHEGKYIPVLVELRKVSEQSSGNISIRSLIETCMAQFDVQLPEDEFTYSLRLGKYVFLLDGFDEVKNETSLEVAEKIQEFCSKYPYNKYIMTSRPTDCYMPLETFTHMKTMPMNKQQAIELASKIWRVDSKIQEFCKQLDNELFETHKSFAENPLLLSMMFLTFMRNLDIPDHLADFYEKVYEALYSKHDSSDKGYYRRDFQCKTLDEKQFRLLFARFCFQTYLHNKYEFSQSEILDLLRKNADFLIRENAKFSNLTDFNAEDYLKDLKRAVCVIVADGTVLRFAHRSFQTYFAAVYTADLNDDKQKKLFQRILGNDNYRYHNHTDYFRLLNQIEHERFMVNALEDTLREVQIKIRENDRPGICMLKLIYVGVQTRKFSQVSIGYNNINHFIEIFRWFSGFYFKATEYNIANFVHDYPCSKSFEIHGDFWEIWLFDDIDASNTISEEDKNKFYDVLSEYCGCNSLVENINKWLDELDKKRAKLSEPDFIDEF